MAIITVPTNFSFTAISKFQLLRASNTVRSKWSGWRTTVTYPFAVWILEGTLVEYDSPNARLIRSFLTQLEGPKNTFRLFVPGHSKPTTNYAGNALVNNVAGIAAGATSMAIDGLTASVPILNEGDYFTVNDELKIATTSISSNASGQATLSFMPALRKSLTDNTVVTFQNPTVLLHMQDNDAANWPLSPPYRHKFKISAIEAIE